LTRTLQLRTRLAIAGLLLIATTVGTGVWSIISFRNVSHVVSDTVTDNERITEGTGQLSSALEREDDAVSLTLVDAARGRSELARERIAVAAALARVTTELGESDDHRLRADVAAYEAAVDAFVAAADVPGARMRYHEQVNPLLRHAVTTTTGIREQRYKSSQSIAEWAGERSTRSMLIVAAISFFAFLLLVGIVVHLARVVMVPIGEMTRAVGAIRQGDFAQRVRAQRDDELGRLAEGLSRMADEIDQFRRSNLGEVLAAKATLEATLAALPDAVLVIDAQHAISAANPRAAALGFEAHSLGDLAIPKATVDAVETVLQTGTAPEQTVDLANTIAVGSVRVRRLLPRIVPIPKLHGAVLVLSDVTELARLDEMRLELVAVASHELRTPLTTLRMTLSMIDERAATWGEHERELVATAMGGVEQLAVLVDEFLDLTRIEAGQLRLQYSRVALGELVEHATRALAPVCEQNQITLAVTGAPGPIAGDPARLTMVVSNLVRNAIEHTPAGGRIAVATTLDTHGTITVDDTGPGVPAEYRERVFDRFFRVDHARAAGVGIGLYVARQVIEAHGGTIRCDASPLGGARFTITLPLDAPAHR
jgi:NtrC-family two-component system sensor histidine kinase KinB